MAISTDVPIGTIIRFAPRVPSAWAAQPGATARVRSFSKDDPWLTDNLWVDVGWIRDPLSAHQCDGYYACDDFELIAHITPTKKPCDCSLATILSHGCREPTHE